MVRTVEGNPSTVRMRDPSRHDRSGLVSDRSVCFMTARELAALLHAREISAVEVLEEHLEQIARVNPLVNAIVTLVPERAIAAAREADQASARGDAVGP